MVFAAGPGQSVTAANCKTGDHYPAMPGDWQVSLDLYGKSPADIKTMLTCIADRNIGASFDDLKVFDAAHTRFTAAAGGAASGGTAGKAASKP